MEKPQNHSSRNFFQEVVVIITKMGIVGYRQVYPNLIATIRGCLKTSIQVPPQIQSAKMFSFPKTGFFPHKIYTKCLFGQL